MSDFVDITKDFFEELKADYDVYGTHTEMDKYRNESSVKDEKPRGIIHTMWHPLTDVASVAEYGKDVAAMLYAIVYDDPGIQHGDVVTVRGTEHEVVGLKYFNTHLRVDVKRKKV